MPDIHEQGDQIFGQLFSPDHGQLVLKAVGFQNVVNVCEPSKIHFHGFVLSGNSFDNGRFGRLVQTNLPEKWLSIDPMRSQFWGDLFDPQLQQLLLNH